jgi:hypothetical protein
MTHSQRCRPSPRHATLSGTPRSKERKGSPKKIPETEAIFAQAHQINPAAASATDVLRVSRDAKATVKIGPCSRGGKRGAAVAAAAHAVAPEATGTPVGLFLPTLAGLCVYGVPSQVPSDCWVDCLTPWWETVRDRCTPIPTLGIHLDHGPEHHRRRPQCMQRLVAFVPPYPRTVRLASSPPYHRKSTPIERCWGILENPWNGTVLDSLDTVLQCARTMPWNGTPPVVALATTASQTGITLTQEAMEAVEARLQRLPKLGKWFVDIVPPAIDRDT